MKDGEILTLRFMACAWHHVFYRAIGVCRQRAPRIGWSLRKQIYIRVEGGHRARVRTYDRLIRESSERRANPGRFDVTER